MFDYLNDILKADSTAKAHSLAHGMIATYEEKFPKLVEYLMKNLVERFNKEVKRRTKVVGAFPSEGSVLRLLVPLAVDTNAKWMDSKYVSWENLEYDCEVEEKFTENF